MTWRCSGGLRYDRRWARISTQMKGIVTRRKKPAMHQAGGKGAAARGCRGGCSQAPRAALEGGAGLGTCAARAGSAAGEARGRVRANVVVFIALLVHLHHHQGDGGKHGAHQSCLRRGGALNRRKRVQSIFCSARRRERLTADSAPGLGQQGAWCSVQRALTPKTAGRWVLQHCGSAASGGASPGWAPSGSGTTEVAVMCFYSTSACEQDHASLLSVEEAGTPCRANTTC